MSDADSVLALLDRRPSTLGAGRLLCIDGPAGSGKTTLAEAVADRARGSRVVHMDDLYAGWSGLRQLADQLDPLLLPLGEGRAGSFRRYDWHAGEFVESVLVDPVPLLVLEGVGSSAARFAPLQTLRVWVEAPLHLRLQRSRARDGKSFMPFWEQWAQHEEDLFTRERTRERADVRIDAS